MKYIKEGLLYDTETAELIGTAVLNNDQGTESLYKTPNGRYFTTVHTSDGEPDKFNVGVPEDEAQEWAEDGCDADTVLKFFGDLIKAA